MIRRNPELGIIPLQVCVDKCAQNCGATLIFVELFSPGMCVCSELSSGVER